MFDKTRINLEKIEPSVIKENHIVGLGFPGAGSKASNYVVIRCVAREKLNVYLYDPIAEGMLSAAIPASTSVDGITKHGFVQPQRPSSQYANGKPQFVFSDINPASPSVKGSGGIGTMYQMFFGISPSVLRVTFSQPSTTAQMSLPIQNPTSSYNQFGAILGETTPIEEPDPISEIFVPPNLDFALGFVNDSPYTINPLLAFVINYFKYEVVVDPDVLYDVLNTTKYRALHTVGGISSYNYSIESNFKVPPLTLGMSKAEIRALYAPYSGVKA